MQDTAYFRVPINDFAGKQTTHRRIARICVPASGSRVHDFVKHTNTILIGEILNCILRETEKKEGRERQRGRENGEGKNLGK